LSTPSRSPADVLLVEDEPSASERLSRAIRGEPRLRLAGVAGSVAEGRKLLAELAPSVLVADLGLPDGSGVELIRAVASEGLATLCLVNTVFADDLSVFEALEAGALGYLLKDEEPEALARCTLELLDGGSPMSPAIARKVLRRLRPSSDAPKAPAAEPDRPHLSERELEVLNLIVKGFKFDEIAGVLGVSAATIATHVQRVYRKLAVHSRAEATYEAAQLGLIRVKE
jgi:DNA-binding NarL/FixJ family response regulator